MVFSCGHPCRNIEAEFLKIKSDHHVVPWPQRLSVIVNHLLYMDADIIQLQEVQTGIFYWGAPQLDDHAQLFLFIFKLFGYDGRALEMVGCAFA